MTKDPEQTSVVSSLDEVDESQCDKWFHCKGCGREFEDPHAEIFNGEKLVGSCECGWSGWKPLREAFKGQTRREKRASENQQITEWCA